jgi:predicted RNase H-like HicB family nuclease
MRQEIIVRAFWDAEAGVWVAEGMNYPGIVTEAENMEKLVAKLQVIIPEIVEANHDLECDEISFRLLSEMSAVAKASPHNV